MAFSGGLKVTGAKKSKQIGFTLRRNDFKKAEMGMRASELVHWLFDTLRETEDEERAAAVIKKAEEATAKRDHNGEVTTLMDSLLSGVRLCELIDVINAGGDIVNAKFKKLKFHEHARAGSFQARENITTFLDACVALGVPKITLFGTEDLVGRTNDKAVIDCLFHLCRVAAKKGIKPPQLIQYELDIERANIEEEDEDEEDQQDQKEAPAAEKPAAAATTAAEPVPAAAAAETAAVAPAEAAPAEAAPTEAAPAEAAPTEAAKPAATAAAPPKSESKSSLQVPAGRGRAHTVAEDELDDAVKMVVEERHYTIPIVKRKMKKKKARDVHKGEYTVNKQKVFVRIVRGLLLARVGMEWKSFADVCDEIQMEYEKQAMATVAE